MSLLEKYLKGKKEMEERIDAIGCEFLHDFKEMIAEASNEEFHEFMCKSGDELDEIERMAALTARLESYEKRCKDEQESKDESKHAKNDGPHIMIIGLG